MAQEILVFKPLLAAARPALGDPAAHGSPQSGTRHPLAPRTGQTMGLAPERDRLSALGLSDTVQYTAEHYGLRHSGVTCHMRKYFQNWCMARGHDPNYCPIATILQFLQDLLEAGRSTSMLKVYLAAISACHVPVDSVSQALIY
ncbi:UNVERIFIED_CONTAM: hypothetical protein FKN15_018841 [Acipenser sinensis]